MGAFEKANEERRIEAMSHEGDSEPVDHASEIVVAPDVGRK
jgi:hypothetical protein